MDLYVTIEGMHCGGCLNRIERVARLEGATRFEMNLAERTARIEYDETNASPSGICEAIRALGYRVLVTNERSFSPVSKQSLAKPTKRTAHGPIPRRKRTLAWMAGGIALFAVLLLLITQISKDAFLRKYGLNDLDTVEIVDELERRIGEPSGFQASVTSTRLVLSDQTGTYRFAMPKDLFYLSIAPYVNQTHPCGNHSLVTCTGELQNVSFHFVIRDNVTGELLFDGDKTSSAKGFVGFWVPRGIELDIEVHSAFGSAATAVSTDVSDGTCLTTMMLE